MSGTVYTRRWKSTGLAWKCIEYGNSVQWSFHCPRSWQASSVSTCCWISCLLDQTWGWGNYCPCTLPAVAGMFNFGAGAPVSLLPLNLSFSCLLSLQCLSKFVALFIIFQTPKHVWDMFNFNTTLNPHGYLVLFVSKTPSVVWYFIMDLIPPKVRSYFALFESKSAVIFICIHCLIISFKLRKFTRILHEVFPSPNLNSYIVFH